MHDTNLEERLRSVLRTEGDSLSLTITTDELERRLALRRRARNGQRLSLMAAGIAVLAVGTMVALSNGWLRGTNVATPPSPSPAPSAPSSAAPSEATSTLAPTALPTASPAPSATPRVAEPVGQPGQAVFVTAVGDSSQPAEAFEVSVYDPITETSRIIATIPGSIRPPDGWLEGGPPQMSASGWLAIPYMHGATEEGATPAIVIVDTRAPDAEPWIIDGYRQMSWDETDKLVMDGDDGIAVAWPMSRFLERVTTPSDVWVAPGGARSSGPAVALGDGARFLARTNDEAQTWGYLGFDGVFIPTTDLPPIYGRSGIERLVNADGHTLGMPCDSGATGGGCFVMEQGAGQEPIQIWARMDETPVHDWLWGADGASVWLLLGDGPDSKSGSLTYAADPEVVTEIAHVTGVGDSAVILGITGESTPGSATAVAVGDRGGYVRAIVRKDGSVVKFDGTSWFAGWAADPAPYDPD